MLNWFKNIGGKSGKKNKNAPRSRRLAMESLENREMLSVSPLLPDSMQQQDEIQGSAAFSPASVGIMAVPDIPTNLRVVDRDINGFRLEWDEVSSSITGYEVRYKLNSDTVDPGNWTHINVSSTDAYCIISGLLEGGLNGVSYDFEIRAVDGSDVSDWAPTVTQATRGTNDPGDTIANSLRLTIDKAKTNDDGSVTFRPTKQTQKIGDGLYDVLDVDMYRFVVSTDLEGKELTFTATGTFLRIFNADGTPVMDGSNPVEGADTITWTPPVTSANTIYYIGVSRADNDDYDPTIPGSGTSTATPGTEVNYTLVIELPTLSNSPGNFSCTGTTESGARFTWTAAPGADGYEIRYKRTSDQDDWVTVRVGNANVQIINMIVGSWDDTDFDFDIRAFNLDANGVPYVYSKW